MYAVYALGSVIVVSLVSVIAAIPLLMKKKISDKVLLFLLSISVGVLLSTVFLDFLPEAMEHKYTMGSAIVILLGFLTMFIFEKLIHWHHSRKREEADCGHSHAYNIAPINLVGDCVHNFIDGLVIAGSYAAGTAVGFAATISIIFHEIPQEIADFGVLLYSGLSRKRALFLNFLSALSAILGTITGILLIGRIESFTQFIIPFAAGNFIYIAASNLTPQLHRQCRLKDTILHVSAMVLGVGIIVLVTLLGPAHGHG